MPLEAGTYVSDLVAGNPDGTDERSEGDDHLRLIKSVLQTTFPNATTNYYFPRVTQITTGYTVLAADHNALLECDTTGGNFTVLLPASGALFNGFQIRVMKSDGSGNNITVDGNGADTINGAATRSVSSQYVVQTFMWSGTEWFTW